MRDSFIAGGLYHGPDARVRLSGSELPILALDAGSSGGFFHLTPATRRSEGYSDDHEAFANELVAAAEQYRDAIAGARLWAEFEQPPSDVEGAA